MRKQRLGKDLLVSSVGYGCMGLSHAFGTPLSNEEAAKKIIQAYKLGYNFFDTAECYTGTNLDGTTAYNEDALGLALKTIPRDKVVIATKTGVSFENGKMLLDASRDRIRSSIEKSLERLGTDYIDLYYLHRIDPKVTPEEVAVTMGELIKEGKIRSWGISLTNEDFLRRAHAVTPVAAIQEMYNMIDRKIENMFNVLEELNIALVVYTPLAKGFLTGRYKERPIFNHKEDNRGARYQFSEEGFKAYQVVFDLINQYAIEKNVSSTQISLAWMINKKSYIIPIPGTRSYDHMKENIESKNVVLSKEEIKAIDKALDTMNICDSMSMRKSDPYKEAIKK